MIQKTGLAWVDADTICLSSDWNFKDNIFASFEEGFHPIIVGGVLSLPKDSEIVKYLVDNVEKINKKTAAWGSMGPHLVNKAFNEYNYLEYVYNYKVFLGIHIHEWNLLWEPAGLDFILGLYSTTKSISAYNQMVTRAKIDKNNLPKGSAMEFFYNRFVLSSGH